MIGAGFREKKGAPNGANFWDDFPARRIRDAGKLERETFGEEEPRELVIKRISRNRRIEKLRNYWEFFREPEKNVAGCSESNL